MTDTLTGLPDGSARGPAAHEARPHVVRRRRPLPGGRAVIGGFLVTVAAVGIFAAYTRATAQPRTMYVVARHNLSLGDHLSAADLGVAPMHLPAELSARRAFTSPSELVGAVVVAPVAAGELIQASAVVAPGGSSTDRQISFAIDPARAVGGHLVPGELVDLLATYGTGGDATTVVVVRAARLVTRSDSSGSLGVKASEIIVLALPDSADVLAVAHAVDSGQITLVRATGAGPANDTGTVHSPQGAGSSGMASASAAPSTTAPSGS